jgi:intein-encoded DNA endonuclease-like protein
MMKRFFLRISKELRELYWARGASTREIGKKIGVWHTTVLKYMRRYGIPRRLRYRCRQATIQVDEHLAYVYGVLCGDASLVKDPCAGKYYISLVCKDGDFAENFAHHLTAVLVRSYNPIRPRREKKRGYYIVQAYVPKLLNSFFEKYPVGEKSWRVPDFVIQKSEGVVSSFLRGFADAEGAVRPYANHTIGYIELCSINREGLEQVKFLLRKLGLTHGKIPIYDTTLRIHARLDLELFRDKIGFSIQRKQRKLVRLSKGYKTERCIGRKPSRKVLYNLYWVRGWSQPKIAKELRVHYKTVGRWMKEEDISCRPPGHRLRIRPLSEFHFQDNVVKR